MLPLVWSQKIYIKKRSYMTLSCWASISVVNPIIHSALWTSIFHLPISKWSTFFQSNYFHSYFCLGFKSSCVTGLQLFPSPIGSHCSPQAAPWSTSIALLPAQLHSNPEQQKWVLQRSRTTGRSWLGISPLLSRKTKMKMIAKCFYCFPRGDGEGA